MAIELAMAPILLLGDVGGNICVWWLLLLLSGFERFLLR